MGREVQQKDLRKDGARGAAQHAPSDAVSGRFQNAVHKKDEQVSPKCNPGQIVLAELERAASLIEPPRRQ
jgi:hypothetical protein